MRWSVVNGIGRGPRPGRLPGGARRAAETSRDRRPGRRAGRSRACSSAGRAPRLHRGCRRFETGRAHRRRRRTGPCPRTPGERVHSRARIHGDPLPSSRVADRVPVSVTNDAQPALADVVAVLEQMYDPPWARDWDAVGLVCGDPDQPGPPDPVRRRPHAGRRSTRPSSGAPTCWSTHHPLLLRAVHSVAADHAKGRVVHRLIRAGCALYVAHTNADVAAPGRLRRAGPGARSGRPGAAGPRSRSTRSTRSSTFVPEADADARGRRAGRRPAPARIGDYARCAWTATGIGTFIPGEGAPPAVGRVGRRGDGRRDRGSRWCCPGTAGPR